MGQADSMKPPAERAGYTSVIKTIGLIVKNEGPGGLMAGCVPTATRAMALNFGMLAFNASAKDALGGMGVTGQAQVFGASAIAGKEIKLFSKKKNIMKSIMQSQKP